MSHLIVEGPEERPCGRTLEHTTSHTPTTPSTLPCHTPSLPCPPPLTLFFLPPTTPAGPGAIQGCRRRSEHFSQALGHFRRSPQRQAFRIRQVKQGQGSPWLHPVAHPHPQRVRKATTGRPCSLAVCWALSLA